MTESQPQTATDSPAAPSPVGSDQAGSDQAGRDQADTAIGELRVEIDAVDSALIELVARRTEISRQVGRLRMASGGTRLSLSREQAIVARFSAELGETGTSLAMLLLRAGRGRL